MEIRWSPRAYEDLARIFERIYEDNPTAAREVIKKLYDGCTALKDFPDRGRIGRMKGRRELVFSPLPYIVVYEVKEHAVEFRASTTLRRIGHKALATAWVHVRDSIH